MSVRTAMISVVIRKDAVHRIYEGGISKFKEEHKIFHPKFEDENLMVYSFMGPMDVQFFTDDLIKLGFTLEKDKKFVDMAVVEFFPTLECDWLKFNESTCEYEMAKS